MRVEMFIGDKGVLTEKFDGDLFQIWCLFRKFLDVCEYDDNTVNTFFKSLDFSDRSWDE